MAATESMWGELPSVASIPNPKRILREQAQALSQHTKNLLYGKVRSGGNVERRSPSFVPDWANEEIIEGGDIVDDLTIVAPTLNNYTVTVARVRYNPSAQTIYPLYLYDVLKDASKAIKCGTEEEFFVNLSEILRSERVHKVIGNLLALVKE